MVQSATRGKQIVCSRCQLLCYRLISWLRVYSHQWINKDCLQTSNVKLMSGWLLFLYCVCKTFFWLYRSVGFEGNFMYAKKGITSVTECADVVGFTFATWQIISCLLCKFTSPGVSVINLFASLRVFVVELGNSSEFLSFFIEVSEEIWRKIKSECLKISSNRRSQPRYIFLLRFRLLMGITV